MKDVEEEIKTFGIILKRWLKTAPKVGRQFRRVEEGAEDFMRKWSKDNKGPLAERQGTVAAATLTGDTKTLSLIHI